ncbi:MAG: tRNA (N(6)-L-threonylcarbamoyladenosine(37)-C(2))-methylthiotransferase MtaB [Lachnospiraceae bacterium]|nr:tRNA (N(6)-L-threonylcarbamoyladenosine(37)-C(2))-methylthiotransferase MtaB [Lachnospiraceae bacterium]
MGKKAALHNLGCKVNAYETEMMRQLLEDAGYEIVPFAPGADIYVINTCTVTNIADRKSRQMLHKARRMNPQAIVVATGCYAQIAGESIEKDDMVDIVLENSKKSELIDALRIFQNARNGVDNTVYGEYSAQKPLVGTGEHTRASIKVQDGCNQFCSYCIIPYARGRVRSRSIDEVLTEVNSLAQNGCREVVLTGIHLSSYGSDNGSSLLSLIQAVHDRTKIARIRLGSLEPGIITEEFAKALHDLPKVCPHFHLSLQSGCTSVLKRMNRRYTAEEYENKCEILRTVFEQPAITTDVIVGFPGETSEEFEETEEFLKRLHLYETHIFKYSRRQGTRAAAMPGQISESEKAVRSNRLIQLGEQNRSLFESGYAGKSVESLFEEKIEINGKEYFTGYTKEYIRTAAPAEIDLSNQIVTGKLGQLISPHVFFLEKD